jgi:hypothetical protein
MKNLERLPRDPFEAFVAIRSAKEGDRRRTLDEISERIRQRYTDYQNHATELADLPAAEPPFDDEQCEALSHCYKIETTPLEHLKQAILEYQSREARATCQYCGIDYPATFDHYLPRDGKLSEFSRFPEYAVHPDNILPCCYVCNRRRGTSWRKDGERTCLHLYFDNIEVKERFLIANIEFEEANVPTTHFSVETDQKVNQEFGRRYQRHVDTLRLRDRFRRQAPARLERLRADIRSLPKRREYGIDDIQTYLREMAAAQRGLLGANHWEVALLMAAAESRDFIEYCLHDEGP